MNKNLLVFILFISIFSCSKDSESPKISEPDPVQLSDEKEIVSFKLTYDGTNYTATIENDSIYYKLPTNVELGDLVTKITVSNKATVSPASGIKQDFSQPIEYTVTAEDKTTSKYKVILTKINSDNSIYTFSFSNLPKGQSSSHRINEVTSDQDTIISYVPYLSPIKGLASEIYIPENATVEPASGETLDYTEPVLHTVTAENGTQKAYLIIVDNSLEEVNISHGILSNAYRGKLPGETISFNTNLLNPVQDSIKVTLVNIDGLYVDDLTLQSVDYETNKVTVLLPDPYKNDSYRFKISIEHDNEDLSDGFVLDYGNPNMKSLDSYTESGTGIKLPHETLLLPGEKFYVDLYVNRLRFNDHSFFLRKNGQDYEFLNVEMNPSWDIARFTMPNLPSPAPLDGLDFEIVIKLDVNEYIYPLLNSENNPIKVIVGKEAVFNSVNKATVVKGGQLKVLGDNLFFPHSSHLDSSILSYSSSLLLKNGGSGYYANNNQLNVDGSMTFDIRETIPSGVYDLYFKNNIIAFPQIDPGIQITIELPPSNHPSLAVTEAKIYTQSNATFGKQILIKFDGDISGANITKIVADNGAIVIENFLLYPSSILTGKIADDQYNTIWPRLGDGHVVIEENGQEYILPFAFIRG